MQKSKVFEGILFLLILVLCSFSISNVLAAKPGSGPGTTGLQSYEIKINATPGLIWTNQDMDINCSFLTTSDKSTYNPVIMPLTSTNGTYLQTFFTKFKSKVYSPNYCTNLGNVSWYAPTLSEWKLVFDNNSSSSLALSSNSRYWSSDYLYVGASPVAIGIIPSNNSAIKYSPINGACNNALGPVGGIYGSSPYFKGLGYSGTYDLSQYGINYSAPCPLGFYRYVRCEVENGKTCVDNSSYYSCSLGKLTPGSCDLQDKCSNGGCICKTPGDKKCSAQTDLSFSFSNKFSTCASNGSWIETSCPLGTECLGNGVCTNTCKAQGGNYCSDGQVCRGSNLSASDSSMCCSGTCETPAPKNCSRCGEGIFNICDKDECEKLVTEGDGCVFVPGLFPKCRSAQECTKQECDGKDICKNGNCKLFAYVDSCGIFERSNTYYSLGTNVSAQGCSNYVSNKSVYDLNVPIVIKTCGDLQNITLDTGANYVLANDIDCSESAGWNTRLWYGSPYNMGFIPIENFGGILDGKGHKIINLTSVPRKTERYFTSLIGTNSGIIKNLGLENVNFQAPSESAGFVSDNYGSVESCYVTGSVNGMVYYGNAAGLVYRNYGNISNSYSLAMVSGNPSYANPDKYPYSSYGGVLVGENYGSINSSYSVGVANNGWDPQAGIAVHTSGSISNSFSVANTPENLAFYFDGGNINNSSSTGRCFSRGGGNVSNCLENLSGNYFKDKNNLPLSNWDFDNVWAIDPNVNNGYPYLRMMNNHSMDSAILLFDVHNVSLAKFGNVTGFSLSLNVINSNDIRLEKYDSLFGFDFRNSLVEFYNGSSSLKYLQPINVFSINRLGKIISVTNKSIDVDVSNYSGFNQRAKLTFGFKINNAAVVSYNGEIPFNRWFSIDSSDPFSIIVEGFEVCNEEINSVSCDQNYAGCVCEAWRMGPWWSCGAYFSNWYSTVPYTCPAGYANTPGCTPNYVDPVIHCSGNKRCGGFVCK